MAKFGKKYQDALKLIEADKFYAPKEAVELVKKTSVTKFDSTVEVAFKLGVNPKYADQQVRGALVLPHGTGKSKSVLVFAKGAKVQEAEAAGADYVGGEELVAKIHSNCTNLRVRHQAFRTEDFTQTAYNTHHIRSCNADFEISPAALDFSNQFFAA